MVNSYLMNNRYSYCFCRKIEYKFFYISAENLLKLIFEFLKNDRSELIILSNKILSHIHGYEEISILPRRFLYGFIIVCYSIIFLKIVLLYDTYNVMLYYLKIMKQIKLFFSIVILLSVGLSNYAQGYHRRIAIIGNSIAEGTGLSDPIHQCFPAQLSILLQQKYGDTCIVSNFGVSGRTMLKHGDFPIWKELKFTYCWNFAPDIFIILLGTNDSKPYNWDPYNNQYFGDYKSMIDSFNLRNPRTKFIVCYPPPAFAVVYDIRDSVLLNGVIPLVDSIAKVTGSDTINFRKPLINSVTLFPDKIHPNAEGAAVMAKIIFNKLVQTDLIHQVDTGYTYVTSLSSPNTLVAVTDRDSVKLSWTTANADTIYLDGQIVAANGSKKVRTPYTTNHILLAKGRLNSDSLSIKQMVIHQILNKMVITPAFKKVNEGDTITLNVSFRDQNGSVIKDSVFNVNWEIIMGEGEFINKKGNSISFIAGNSDTAKITVSSGDITSNICKITIKTVTDISNINEWNEEVTAYPNPSNNILNFTIITKDPNVDLIIKILDIKGSVKSEKSQKLAIQGKHIVSINTENLDAGIYLYEVDYSGKTYNGKIIIQTK
jgi:acyl-CoA thioesterase I